ncbi:hypothetical protein [Streptomyces sp. NPDC002537]
MFEPKKLAASPFARGSARQGRQPVRRFAAPDTLKCQLAAWANAQKPRGLKDAVWGNVSEFLMILQQEVECHEKAKMQISVNISDYEWGHCAISVIGKDGRELITLGYHGTGGLYRENTAQRPKE